MSQVAVLPHQTSNGSASASSASQPDIGQLSLHNVASTRRKSSFSNVNNYRTMPLSRTRSLLANINGVASNGKQPQDQLIWPRPFFTIISRKTYKTSLLVLSKNLSITKLQIECYRYSLQRLRRLDSQHPRLRGQRLRPAQHQRLI